MKRIKVGIAMSGGVDSTATALMLKQEYTVTGYFMQLAQPDLPQQIDKVKKIADALHMELSVIDLTQPFQKEVIDYFCNTYTCGRTPNPCIVCNRQIKFGLFLTTILGHGEDMIATGHYARVRFSGGDYHLYKGVDPTKDQSYFLSRLSQEQLAKVLFPLGGMKKAETYSYTEKYGFTSFRGQESQDVCFLKDSSVADFLRIHTSGQSPGVIKNSAGEILGEHRGIGHYTIGQRRGLGISASTPYYVIALNAQENSVIVGKNDELYRNIIHLNDIHWISGREPNLSRQYTVKIRYTHRGSNATISRNPAGGYVLTFNEPQRAVTPGQFCVMYDDDEVIGSAEIVT